MPRDWKDDAQSGLKSIASRADSLSRFMQAYTRLAKLPPPQKDDVDLGELVERVAKKYLDPSQRAVVAESVARREHGGTLIEGEFRRSR